MRFSQRLVAALACAANVTALVINIDTDEHKSISLTRLDDPDTDIIWDDHKQKPSAYVRVSGGTESQHVIQSSDNPVHAMFTATCAPDAIYPDTVLYARIQQGIMAHNGGGAYPKRFMNGEGFTMQCPGNQYWEYPLDYPNFLDRVVYDEDGIYCNTITHRGAGGRGYVVCGTA